MQSQHIQLLLYIYTIYIDIFEIYIEKRNVSDIKMLTIGESWDMSRIYIALHGYLDILVYPVIHFYLP